METSQHAQEPPHPLRDVLKEHNIPLPDNSGRNLDRLKARADALMSIVTRVQGAVPLPPDVTNVSYFHDSVLYILWSLGNDLGFRDLARDVEFAMGYATLDVSLLCYALCVLA